MAIPELTSVQLVKAILKGYEVKIDRYGDRRWYLKGELHRTDGPAYEGYGGDKNWYLNGKRHREDGPAYESADGHRVWYLNGKRHREDGPAYESADGSRSWWLNGKVMSEGEFNRRVTEKDF